MLTPSSSATGIVSRGQKEGSGSAALTTDGDFSGSQDLDYLIQVDLAGEVGVATFLWSDDGGDTVDATGVVTSTSLQTLNNGVRVSFAGGSGTDFTLGDVWRFKGILPYGKGKVIDRDRDTEFRSGDPTTGAITVTIDLGSAKTPTAFILMDHNLTANAQIRLLSSDDNFATIVDNDVVTYRSGSILHYIGSPARTHRYWRVSILDTGNSDGYLRWSEMFLGTYTELSRSFELGDVRSRVRLAQRSLSPAGRYFGGLNDVVTVFNLMWDHLSSADKTSLIAVYNDTNDTTNNKVLPVFFNPDSGVLTDIFFCEWEGSGDAKTMPPFPERFQVPSRLVEIPRTV